jgi:hypothetical protein
MKLVLATFLIAAMPMLTFAQSGTAAKPTAKAAAKKSGKRAAQKTAEEPVEGDLSPADLEIAKQVFVGDIPCELGATVHVAPHQREGFFIVRTGTQQFRMRPVESRTGAIRLEDSHAGAMWLQLLNKSMLMSQKLGRRLADECMSPKQTEVAESLKKNPLPSLLEPMPAVKTVPFIEPRPQAIPTAASTAATSEATAAAEATAPEATAPKAAAEGTADVPDRPASAPDSK